ncbi:hypothetical protein MTO96_036473 [Rhipicephalus appendiculatus]
MNKAEEKDLIRLKTSEATACIHIHGATLISWVFKGKERIFVSDKAIFDNKKAIRGGGFPSFFLILDRGAWGLSTALQEFPDGLSTSNHMRSQMVALP